MKFYGAIRLGLKVLNFQIEANGRENPRGSLYKLLELLNFPKANNSTKNFENSASKIKCNGIHGEKVEKIY